MNVQNLLLRTDFYRKQLLGAIADCITLPLSVWVVLHFFLLVKDYLGCLLICPSSRITYIEMHTARGENNQRCDRSQAVAANSKLFYTSSFEAAKKANSHKRCRFSTHALSCFLYSALQDHDLMLS